MKQVKCIKCGETDEAKFYPSCLTHHDYRCKVCFEAYRKQYTASHPQYREYLRQYYRQWMRNHPEVNNINFRKWYSQHQGVHYERRLTYARANPQRHNAHSAALRKFKVAEICKMDGCLELGERHHEDYNKPYEIRWLCRKHHKELHRQIA